MKSWEAHQLTAQQSPGEPLLWVLVLLTDEGPEALSTCRLASQTLEIKPWVLEWGELVESGNYGFLTDAIGPVGDLAITCTYDLLHLAATRRIENRPAALYQVRGLSFELPAGWGGAWGGAWGYLDRGSGTAVSAGLLYTGIVREIQGSPQGSTLVLEDASLQWNLPVPVTLIGKEDRPFAPESSLSKPVPRMYGIFSAENEGEFSPLPTVTAPATRLALAVDEVDLEFPLADDLFPGPVPFYFPEEALQTLLSTTLSDTEDVLSFSSTAGFPEKGFLLIENEVLWYGQKSSAGVSAVERGLWFSAPRPHAAGAQALLIGVLQVGQELVFFNRYHAATRTVTALGRGGNTGTAAMPHEAGMAAALREFPRQWLVSEAPIAGISTVHLVTGDRALRPLTSDEWAADEGNAALWVPRRPGCPIQMGRTERVLLHGSFDPALGIPAAGFNDDDLGTFTAYTVSDGAGNLRLDMIRPVPNRPFGAIQAVFVCVKYRKPDETRLAVSYGITGVIHFAERASSEPAAARFEVTHERGKTPGDWVWTTDFQEPIICNLDVAPGETGSYDIDLYSAWMEVEYAVAEDWEVTVEASGILGDPFGTGVHTLENPAEAALDLTLQVLPSDLVDFESFEESAVLFGTPDPWLLFSWLLDRQVPLFEALANLGRQCFSTFQWENGRLRMKPTFTTAGFTASLGDVAVANIPASALMERRYRRLPPSTIISSLTLRWRKVLKETSGETLYLKAIYDPEDAGFLESRVLHLQYLPVVFECDALREEAAATALYSMIREAYRHPRWEITFATPHPELPLERGDLIKVTDPAFPSADGLGAQEKLFKVRGLRRKGPALLEVTAYEIEVG